MSNTLSPVDELDMPFKTWDAGLRVQVRVTPGAARNGIRGIQQNADGSTSLKVSVTAPPDKGKANASLVRVLAKAWNLRASAIRIAAGHADRKKTVDVSGDSAILAERVAMSVRGPIPLRKG